jgi:hypothetical protein
MGAPDNRQSVVLGCDERNRRLYTWQPTDAPRIEVKCSEL